MAQHDYIIDNQTSASLRSDLNNALAAIVSQNSGATAPATTYANQFWYDTSTDTLKQRNENNTVWISLGTVDQTNNKFEPNQTFATQAEAEAGSNNTKAMTALRTAQAIAAQASTPVNVGIGLNQTWQVVARTSGTAYQNTTGKSIMVAIRHTSSTGNVDTLTITASPDNVTYTTIAAIPHIDATVMSFIVPQLYYYKIAITGGTFAVSELR